MGEEEDEQGLGTKRRVEEERMPKNPVLRELPLNENKPTKTTS